MRGVLEGVAHPQLSLMRAAAERVAANLQLSAGHLHRPRHFQVCCHPLLKAEQMELSHRTGSPAVCAAAQM